MIKKVAVERVDGKGSVLTLPFTQKEIYRYIVSSSDGIGPVKAQLFTSKFANKD